GAPCETRGRNRMPDRRQLLDPTEPRTREFSSVHEVEAGIARLRRRIADIEAIDPRVVRYDHDTVQSIEEDISNTILDVFGVDSPEYLAHRQFQFFRSANRVFANDDDAQEFFAQALPPAIALIENLVLRLEEKRAGLGQGRDARLRSALEGLDLHPRIARACGHLPRDGRYADAVLAAAVALEHLVQEKSGRHDAVGAALMAQVFSPDDPVLALNGLADPLERD